MAKESETLPQRARDLLNEIKDISKEINDVSRFWDFISKFPPETTTDTVRRFVEEYLPKEKVTVGEAYKDTFTMRKILASQIGETLERVKKYYPDLYYKYFHPQPHAAISSKARLVEKLLKYRVYGAASKHIPEIADKIAYIDERTRELLKKMIAYTVYNPPSVEVKRKEWEKLVYSEPFKKLMIMLSLSGAPKPPPDIPPKEELDKSLTNLYRLYQQADLVLKLLAGFRTRQRADIVRETLLTYLPKKNMTVEQAKEIVATKIMPGLLHTRDQLMSQFAAEFPEYALHLMRFKRPDVVVKRVAPSRWRRVMAFIRYHQPITIDELITLVGSAYPMSPEEIRGVVEELKSVGYVIEENGKLVVRF